MLNKTEELLRDMLLKSYNPEVQLKQLINFLDQCFIGRQFVNDYIQRTIQEQ